MAEAEVHHKGEVNLASLVENARTHFGKDVGALGCFVGIVRGTSKRGESIKYLHYEAAEEAREKLLEIANQVEKSKGIRHVQIHHIIDNLAPGEDAIYVIVGGEHRKEVFAALSEIMNRVKSEVMIWKKEITERGEYWI
jgi:molybdopterin synthase catalytic subunit